VLVAVGLGTFMSALDGSIVNVILPLLSRHFDTSLANIEWVVTVYLLVVSGLLLTFGRLSDLQGPKPVFLAGFFLFTFASALCGLAPSLPFLVAARGFQALGAAMLFATSPALLTLHFPGERRGRVLGLAAMMTYLGLTVGPPLGGWIAETFSWRAVFYVNVPVGLFAVALGARAIPKAAPTKRREPFDLLGAFLFTSGLSLFLLALNQGHAWGWTSLPIASSSILAAGLLGAFLQVELHKESPMLDLRLFRNRAFSQTTASAFLNYVAVFHLAFVLPFYLIQGRGLSASAAGFLLMFQSLAMALAAPLSGALSDRVGPRGLCTLGTAILAASLYYLSTIGGETPLSHVGAALALAGLGTGIFISPNNSTLMGSAPRERQGIAASVLAEARNVGMVVGIGLSGAIAATVLSRHAVHDARALAEAMSACLKVAAATSCAGGVLSALGHGKPTSFS
jgi:EmrB/QacA subfamily drug resistance transporter